MSCCSDFLKVASMVSAAAGSGGGPYTVVENPAGSGTFIVTDTSSGNTFTLPTLKEKVIDADGDTFICVVEGAGVAGGDEIQFTVDGNIVGSVDMLAVGIPKWTFDGIVDPLMFVGSPTNCAFMTPLLAAGQAGIYVSDGSDGFVAGEWVKIENGVCNQLGGVTTPSVVTNLLAAGNQIATHTSSDATVTNILETITTLADNGDGTYTFTSEDGTVTVVTAAPSVISNVLTVGNQIGTHTSADGTVTNLLETITGLSYTVATSILTFTKEDGTTDTVDLSALTTDIYVTGASFVGGILTLTDNDGVTPDVTVDLSALQSIVTPSVTGQTIATHDDGSGTTTNIQESITTLADNGDGTYTYTSEDGTVTTTAAPGAETVTTLVDNGDGTYTYTSEDGTATILTAAPSVVSNLLAAGNQIATHTSADGTISNVLETVTTLVDNGDGTYTYTSEDGTATVLTAAPSVVTNTKAGQLIATHTSADGTIVEIDETITTLVDNGDNTFTYTSEDGTVTTYTSPVSTYVDTNTPANLADHSWTHTSGDGTAVTSNEALTSLALGATCNTLDYTDENNAVTNLVLPKSVLTDNGDCTYDHDDGCGTIVTIDAKKHIYFELGQMEFMEVETLANQAGFIAPYAGTIIVGNWNIGTVADAPFTVDIAIAGAVVETLTIPAGTKSGAIAGGSLAAVAAGALVNEAVVTVDGGTAKDLVLGYTFEYCNV